MRKNHIYNKSLIAVLFLALFGTGIHAQNHLQFKGHDIAGPVSSFVEQLKIDGYVIIGASDNGTIIYMQGTLIGKPTYIRILATPTTKTVYCVQASFTMTNRPLEQYGDHNVSEEYRIQHQQIVEALTTKYDIKNRLSFESFRDKYDPDHRLLLQFFNDKPYERNGGFRANGPIKIQGYWMEATLIDEMSYAFVTDNGNILVCSMFSKGMHYTIDGPLSISLLQYYDKQGMNLNKQEQENMMINEL